MSKSLVFELGCEDLPALQIGMAIDALRDGFVSRCKEARIVLGEVKAYASPRRLALLVDAVAERQSDLETLKVGPAVAACRAPDGSWTPAALGFLKGLGASTDQIEEVTQERKKGKPMQYIAVKVCEKGEASEKLLGKILEDCLAGLHWAKPMRWSDEPTLFARPVHWILCRFGEDILDMRFAGVSAGTHTYGHRFMAPDAIEVTTPAEYVSKLRDAKVLVDTDERRAKVMAEAHAAAKSVGGSLVENPELLEEVVEILEWPVGIVGAFDPAFLKIPHEVITTSMVTNQRYFSVVDADGNLMPNFVTLSNTEVRDRQVVARGNERVLVARLKDAEFFYAEDRKHDLEYYNEKLTHMRYIEGMGSTFDKVLRVECLSETVADLWHGDVDKEKVRLTAHFCKADLATNVVYEFPEVEGMMGDYYGREEGLPVEVCTGIRETYSPRQAGAPVASTLTGAIAGIADKLDTITALFALGRIPTGAADPFALRRSANGIMRTLIEHRQTLDLSPIVQAAIACVRETEARLDTAPKTHDDDALCAQILDFMKTRLRFMLIENHATEVVDSVLDISSLRDIPAIVGRVETLSRHRASEMFESLATTFKRVANIVRLANVQTGDVDPGLFEDTSENTFHDAIMGVSSAYRDAMDAKDFDRALSSLETLRAPADAFFDAVLVNTENEAVRLNRLALLASVQSLFDIFCDVRKL